MKALTDYPTPETEAHFKDNVWSKFDYGSRRHLAQEDIIFTESLERRLAACREALEHVANSQLTLTSLERIARNTLALTEPLAELKP